VCALAPLRQHHVGQEREVDRQRGTVRGPFGETSYVMGVSCHVGDTSGFIEVSCSWQL